MTDPNNASQMLSNAGGTDPLPGNTHAQKTRTGVLPAFAFLLACAAIGIQFYPDIRDAVERHTGPITWLPREIRPVQSVGNLQPQNNTDAPADVRSAIAEIESSLTALKTTIEQMEDVKTEAAAAMKAAQASETEAASISRRIDAIEAATTQQNAALQASVAGLTEAISKLTPPSAAPLLAAKLVLLSANSTLTPEDIDQLAALAGTDPALAETAGQLKALAGENIPTITALQAQFNATKDEALHRALAMRLGWVASSFSMAQEALSDIGLVRATAEEKDEMVINEASRQMESGRLGQALFELQAASPELRTQLAPWMSAAQLRVTLDKTLLQLVDGLLARKVTPPDAQGAG